MKISSCLLNNHNKYPIGDISLGVLIEQSGKEHLWDKRILSVDTIVIHFISALLENPQNPYSTEDILKIFPKYGVSSHYLITRRGKVFCLVPESMKAWHCGPSQMPFPDNRNGVNDFSIGIELVATEQSGFTQSQYTSLCALCCAIETRRNKMFTYVGHEHIAGAEAVRLGLRAIAKVDPGDKFNWEEFYRKMTQCRGNFNNF